MVNAKVKIILLIILLISMITGCKGISEQDAEQTALLFLHDRVKFYSTEGNTTKDLPQYDMNVVNSYKDDNNWHFVVTVSSTVGEETRSAKMKVVIDGSTNKVVNFEPNVE